MCLISVKTALWKRKSVLIVLLDLTWRLTAKPMEHVRVSNLMFCYKVRLICSCFPTK